MNKDTLYIQGLLDKCGEVRIPEGVYMIDTPLVIYDDTHLILTDKTVFRLCDGANCQIMINEGLAKKYNKNITIEGGIWDGNNENQVRQVQDFAEPLTAFDQDFYYGIMLRFVGMENFTMKNLTLKDPESYPVQISMVKNFTVENITFDYNLLRTNMDGIHINGPAQNGRICNIFGSTNDDMVALNCDDCYETEITHGPIDNIYVDNLHADNGYTAVRLLSCGSPLSNVTVKNVYGKYRYNAVSFTHHRVHQGECSLSNVHIENLEVSKADAANDYAVIWFAEGTHSSNVTLKNIRRIENIPSAANTVKIDKNTVVEDLTIDNVTQEFIVGEPMELFKNSGTVTKLIIRNQA
ncbi:MAG: hypothetical protein E7591_08335 [Ruminococcaceae bacterium]|nr:hypothetical protein [Oscillospiraceae bacterium]